MAGSGPSTANVFRVVAIVIASALLLYGAYLVRGILVFVVVAMFLAVGLDPVVRALGRARISRGKSVALVFLGATLFVAGFVASVSPPLIRQTQRLAREVPQYAQDLSQRSDRFAELDEKFDITTKLRSSINNLPSIAARSAGSALGIARSIGRIVFSVLTVLILTIYFMLDLPGLLAGAKSLVPRSRRIRFQQLSEKVFSRISGYMIGQLTVSLIGGLVGFVFLTIVGVPFALPLAMWISLSALVPMVGSMLGAIPSIVVAFFSSIPLGFGTLVFFIGYQQIENYVVAPRVMRRAVNISPAAVILAALIGGTLLGFVGALLAIPVAASIKVLTLEVWVPRQEAA